MELENALYLFNEKSLGVFFFFFFDRHTHTHISTSYVIKAPLIMNIIPLVSLYQLFAANEHADAEVGC